MSWLTDTIFGKNDFKATQYNVDQNLFQDPNAAENRGRAWAGWDSGSMDGLRGRLEDRSKGIGQSMAELELGRATNRNTGLAQALMASGSGGTNPALAMRTGLLANANANQEAAGQSAMLRLQEQQQADMALGAMLNSSRAAGLGYDWNQQQSKMGLAKILSDNYNSAMQTQAGVDAGNADRQQRGVGAILAGGGAALGGYFTK